ncbi:hypothetical protein [Streptomyces sp. PT12]|uniref:hypothetical protein n=1 Tax=Streptomyces sp. PT12 TaxID=1510197 RepID=UPI000DE2068C|nr:hypothetical protein [Streptomyces sp. PT12]RBM17507.1 hypothetical protein DEH69_14760 [Streptomyces sp. PT12]
MGVAQRPPAAPAFHLVEVNGAPALLVTTHGRPYGVFQLRVDEDGRVRDVYLVVNPDKLAHLTPPEDPGPLAPFAPFAPPNDAS